MALKRIEPEIGDRIKILDRKTQTYFYAKVTKLTEAWVYAKKDGESDSHPYYRSQCANGHGQHIYG